MPIDLIQYLSSIFPTSGSPLGSAASFTASAPAVSAGRGASDIILTGSTSTVSVQVIPLSDEASGPRLVTSPVAGLVVGIAKVDAVEILTALPHFKTAAYAVLAQGSIDVPGIDLRVGETIDTPRRLAEHLALPPCSIEEILLVGSADFLFAPFGKDAVLALQWALHRLAVRAGRAVVHGAAPQRPALLDIEPARLARWVCDLRPMLKAAGIALFEPQGRIIRPVVIEPKDPDAAGGDTIATLLRGYRVDLPAGLTERADARHYKLKLGRTNARATVVDGLTVVHAGAIVDPSERSGVQPCIVRKRRHMAERGILQWTQDGLQRLTCDVALPTLTNAARTISGSNVPGIRWIPAV